MRVYARPQPRQASSIMQAALVMARGSKDSEAGQGRPQPRQASSIMQAALVMARGSEDSEAGQGR
eukprot:gene2089-18144_t